MQKEKEYESESTPTEGAGAESESGTETEMAIMERNMPNPRKEKPWTLPPPVLKDSDRSE